MEAFTVRDLREHTGSLIQEAEAGNLSLITKHGRPIFLAVPFNETLLQSGLKFSVAAHLYKEGFLSLSKSAKLAGESLESFMEKIGFLGIEAVQYNPKDIQQELKDFR